MCGRYTLRARPGDIAKTFHVPEADVPVLVPRFNAAPRQTLPVVGAKEEGGRGISLMQWGLIPSWSKEKPKVRPINARADAVATNGLFRNVFRKKRCLVPADGYYEWKAEGKAKQPYLFEVDGGGLFAFAGVWDSWKRSKDADPLFTFATITTDPNPVAATVHDRMPVILPEKVWEKWLDPAFQDTDALLGMLRPLPARALALRPVNPAMGNVKFEGPACIEPPPESAAVAGGGPVKRARKPRAKKGSGPEADRFST